MKKISFPHFSCLMLASLVFCRIILCPAPGLAAPAPGALQDGDIIFQETESPQSLAIKLATKSRYSHCGILFKEQDKYYVTEAAQPVQTIPLEQWIKRGIGQYYVVKRLKNAQDVLTPKVISAMKHMAHEYDGTPYDIYFEWSDTTLYCSELVWKLYQRASGIEICPLRKLKDFNVDNFLVYFELEKRYGKNIPYDQLVVAPSDILNSPLLDSVVEYPDGHHYHQKD